MLSFCTGGDVLVDRKQRATAILPESLREEERTWGTPDASPGTGLREFRRSQNVLLMMGKRL
jgi:hypothetical protein